MSIILKEEASNTIPTPGSGKATLFVDDNGVMSIKNDAGATTTFPTLGTSNTQVLFTDGTAIGGDNDFVYDKNTNVLTLAGNLAAANVKTDNLLYANGVPWDLSDPGGSNTQIQFNDDESFGGSAAFTFNKSSNLVSMGGALSVTGNANVGNLGTAGQVIALGNVTGSYFIGNGSQLTGIDATAIQNGTANVRTFNNGNVTVSAAGTANVVVVTSTGANISGTANITGNANVGNLGTTGLAVSGNAIISGNLTVDGNLVYVNVETVAVEDPIIQLQTGPNGAAPSSNSGKDIGSALNYYNSQARVAFMGWDVSNAEFGLASEASITNEVVTFSTYGNLRAGVYFGNGSGLSALTGANVTGTVANATHASTANTVVDAAQPNITSVGTLTSLAVTGNANVGNIGGAAGVFTANVSAGNLSTGGTLNVTGNANVVNLGASGTVTVTGNASAGNLSTGGTLSVTGNGNLGNVGAAAGVFTSNVTAGNVYANSGTVGASLLTGTLTTNAQPNITSVGTLGNLSVTSNITAGNANLGNLVTANVANLVDLNVSGNANIGGGSGGNISGANVIAANTFVGNLQGRVANGNSNVSIPAANGNINISAVGTANVLVVTGTGVNVAGTLNATGNANVGNLGATGVTATTLGGSLTTASQPNITSVGTLTSLAITGNANTGNLGTTTLIATTGNITTINSGLLQNGNSNIAITANGNVSIQAAGSTVELVVTSTGVNVAGTLNATGNANVGNIGAAVGVFTGNISSLNANLGNLVAANVANLVDLNVTGNANIGSGSGGNLSGANVITANTFVGNLQGQVANGNSNLNIPAANGNINLSVGGTSNVLIVTSTGVNVTGTLNSSGNANVGNLGTAGLITATGNVTGGNLTTAGKVVASTLESNVSTGTAPFTVTSTTRVANLNVAYANVADIINVTTQSSGNAYLIFANGLTGNVSETANATFVANTSNGALYATTFVGALSGAATTAGTVTTAAQPNITSVGTLTTLGVNGTVTAVAFTANTGVFTGNGSGLSALAGGNVTGQVANALVASTVYTNAQPNITSVGTLSSLAVTANVAAGNLTTTGVLSVTGTGVSSIAGNLDMTSNTIINLATPTNANDAATKQYVDDLASTALVYHEGVTAATTDTLATTTGGTITYNNGASGVGANLVTTGSFNLIDTANVQTVGTRILVKDEANAAHNGIYTWANATTIVRSTDADEYGVGAGNLSLNDYFFVSGGSVNKGSAYVLDSPSGTITFGTSNITFAQFSSSQVYSNGTGLGLSGTVFSVNASQTQVTALGTVTTGTWNSLVGSSATFAAGLSGANLASITGANVTGTVPAATVAGTVTTAAQPNITSVGTLTGLGVNGTVTAVAFTANTGVFTGNGSGLSAIAGANVTGTVSSATTAGTVTTAAQPNITSVGTLSSLAVTGNASAGNISTGGALSVTGNANVGNIGAAAGVFTSVSGNGSALTALNASNISTGTLDQARLANSTLTLGSTTLTLGATTTTVAGLTSVTSTTFVGALTGAATTAGTVTTAAQPNITSVGTLSSLSSSGNITAPNLIANTGMFISSVNAAVSAAGTAQGNATALTTQINVVSTVASGAGVRLPTAVAGMRVTIMNTAANALAVYPATSGIINSAAANVAFSQAAGSRLDFVAVSTTQWYTLNATYA